jgi:hypothetical protein
LNFIAFEMTQTAKAFGIVLNSKLRSLPRFATLELQEKAVSFPNRVQSDCPETIIFMARFVLVLLCFYALSSILWLALFIVHPNNQRSGGDSPNISAHGRVRLLDGRERGLLGVYVTA